MDVVRNITTKNNENKEIEINKINNNNMKIKLKLKFLFISLLFFSFSYCQENTNNRNITINYTNSINGYNVTVLWIPKIVKYKHVVGPAIVEFKNTSKNTSFSLAVNNFGILKNRLPFTYLEKDYQTILSDIPEKSINLFYEIGYIEDDVSFGTTDEPFFFQDVDFDNNKELIIVEIGIGQRDVSTFKVYNFSYGDINPERLNITYKEPYIYLDEMSEIDSLNKTITIYHSSGACSSSYDIYALNRSENSYENNEYILDTIIEQESDEDFCYELKYKIINNKKIFISKKTIQ